MRRKIARIMGGVIVCLAISLVIISDDSYAAQDTTAPQITSVNFCQSLTAPDVLDISYSVEEEGVGMNRITVSFLSYIDGQLREFYVDWQSDETVKFSGTYSMSEKISSDFCAGTWYVSSVCAWDKKGNRFGQTYPMPGKLSVYNTSPGDVCVVNGGVEGCTELNILPMYETAFETNMSNPNLLTMVEQMNEGETAMVYYSNDNAIAKKELFDAIKGIDKTLVFSNDATHWIVNGSSITKDTKDIDLRMTTSLSSACNYGASSGKVAVIKFKDNGELPGDFTIRANIGYMFGKGTLVYYYTSSDLSLENTDAYGYYDGDAKWCEFNITHNSTFVLSNGKLINAPKSVKLKTKKGKKLAVSWSKVPGITKYQVTYSTSAKFAKNNKTITVKGNKATLKKLKANKKYYIKVRAYKSSKVHGIYSKTTKSGKIKR